MWILTHSLWLGFQLAKVRIVATLLSGSRDPACVKALFINEPMQCHLVRRPFLGDLLQAFLVRACG